MGLFTRPRLDHTRNQPKQSHHESQVPQTITLHQLYAQTGPALAGVLAQEGWKAWKSHEPFVGTASSIVTRNRQKSCRGLSTADRPTVSQHSTTRKRPRPVGQEGGINGREEAQVRKQAPLLQRSELAAKPLLSATKTRFTSTAIRCLAGSCWSRIRPPMTSP